MGVIAKGLRSLAVKAAKEEAEKVAEKVVERAAAPRPRAPKKAPAPTRRSVAPTRAPALAVKPSAPAIISARSGTAKANAADVLAAAGGKRKASESFANWREKNDAGLGTLFDYSRLSEVPPVEQYQLPRYVPARGPSPRIVDALANPEVARGINETVERGIEGGGMDWYNTEPMRERMLSVMPEIDAEAAYPRMMDIMAATSPRSKVADNIRTGSFYNYRLANDLPIEDKPAPGYGSVAQNLHRDNVRGIADLGGWDIFKNPKPASFSSNLQGNQAVATIDTHNFRLPGILSGDPRFLAKSVDDPAVPNPSAAYKRGELDMAEAIDRPAFWESKPNANEYGYYEQWQQDQAAKLGISPAQYQASMWLGGGDDTGLGSTPEPFLKTLEARVKYTADRLGLEPDVVLEQMLRGDIPLLAKGGHVDAAALAAKYDC